MGVELIEKKKRGLTCADCGESAAISKSASGEGESCDSCGSHNIKKSLVVVRKSVADTEEELDQVEDEEGVDENDDELDDDDDDEDDEDSEIEDDDDELDDEEDDDDDEDEDEDDDEDEDETPEPQVKKSLVGVEALNIATAFAQDVAKVFTGKKASRENYETVMTELNNVMDSAADVWFAGGTVAKSKKNKHASVIRDRVNGILNDKEGNSEVTKIAKRDDLPEDVRKSLEEADKIVERDKQREWLDVAKGYSHFSGKPEELAKTLRSLSDSNPDAFAELKKSLDSAEESLKQSEIFKSFGAPGGGRSGGDDTYGLTEEEIAKSMKDDGKTREQVLADAMSGSSYKPTNV